jgi:hypothetical protein
MVGGSVENSTALVILLTMGTVLVFLGILIYTDHLLDIHIKPVEKSSVNQYMGYAAFTIGLILLYLALNMRA